MSLKLYWRKDGLVEAAQWTGPGSIPDVEVVNSKGDSDWVLLPSGRDRLLLRGDYLVDGEEVVSEVVFHREYEPVEESAVAPALRWTSEPPKTPGWYWVRGEGLNAASVEFFGDYDVRHPGVSWRFDSEFAGPIPEPLED